MEIRFRGEGPGARTRDGCSVELYARLPPAELDTIGPWLEGESVLELGCGTGRMTRPLLARGYRVTAVDNSPEMLAHVPAEASAVCADIEDLALQATFDNVILASCLVNVWPVRAALLATCCRHLRRGGRLLFERYDPAWVASVQPGRAGVIGGIEQHIERVERHADRVDVTLVYRDGGDEWRHHFPAWAFDDDEACSALEAAGFEAPAWIDRRWGVARRRDASFAV